MQHDDRQMTQDDDFRRTQALAVLLEAEKASEALAALVQEETERLRDGSLQEALALTTRKASLALAHARAVQNVRHHAVTLHRYARAETLAFRERERELLKAAETNVRLLGTLRAALDSVMRAALSAQSAPASPYARTGTISAPQRTEHRLLSVRS